MPDRAGDATGRRAPARTPAPEARSAGPRAACRSGASRLLVGLIGLGLPIGLGLAIGGCAPRTDTAEADRPGELRLTLLGTTDVHAQLVPWDYARAAAAEEGSLAQVAALVDSVRRADGHVLLFDSGDLLEGTPLAEHAAETGSGGAHPVIAAMNAAGYDAAAIGNHEFNYGLPFLRAALEGAAFPFLSANAYRAGTDSTAWPAATLLEVGGARVGVLGLTTPGVQIWDRGHVEGRLRFGDLVEAARREVPRLRERGADVVVLLVHAGLGPGSSYGESTGVPEENPVARLLREVPGIDIAFIGHSHRERAGERVGDALVLQAGAHARSLAYAHLVLEPAEEGLRVARASGGLLPTRGVEPTSSVLEAVEDAHRRTVAWLETPLGWTPDRWSAATARFEDTPIADLIQAAQREASGAELSSTAIFDPSVAFGPGPITRRHLLALYRYPNTLRAVRIDGAGLRAYLEWSARYYRTWPAEPPVNDSVPGFNFDVLSGVEYALDLRRPPGERVTALRVDGRPVSPTDSFTLALNNYRQSGGGDFPGVVDAPVVHRGEERLSALLGAFVAARDTLTQADVFEANWRLLPPEVVARLRAER